MRSPRQAALPLAAILAAHAAHAAQPPPDSENAVRALASRLPIEQKIGQLTMLSAGRDATGPVLSRDAERKIRDGLAGSLLNAYGPAATRRFQRIAVTESPHGIPLLFAYDVIHGHRTIFPINLALSCSWDIDLIRRTASRAAAEARADGLHWTFAPMCDISRDPRWGRVSEGAGEDPGLASEITSAMVRGFQESGGLMATVKHFALYGAPDAGRDYNTADMSRHRMFNEYLPPYHAGVAAGAAAVMTAFNEVDGIPATASRWLLRGLLRGQWSFNGLVVSDYNAIAEIAAHGAATPAEAARLALQAGVDVDMVSESFLAHLPALAARDPQTARLIDEACLRVLLAKYRLGLFRNPYTAAERPPDPDMPLALEAAAKSMVLLKNSQGALPLSKTEKVLFAGPFVHDRHHQLGAWRAAGDSSLSKTLAETLHSRGLPFTAAPGCPFRDTTDPVPGGEPAALTEALVREAVSLARDADKIVLFLGEPFNESGEGASKTSLRLPAPQRRLFNAMAATGKPLILVIAAGRPLVLAEEEPRAAAILYAWFGGHMAAPALADLLYGDAEPQARLTSSFPRHEGQIPVFYNHKPTGRPGAPGNRYTSRYLDCPNDPLYPFGWGLTYSRVEYSPARLSAQALRPSETIRASAVLANTGSRPAVETAQLYIRDLTASVTRPARELKGFRQIRLDPGQSATAEFEITEPMLRFYDASLSHRSEPGRFLVWIAPHSAADPGAAEFELLDPPPPKTQGNR